MQLTINGQNKNITNNTTVADLIAQLCKNPKNIISELNGNILPSCDWGKISLKEGDQIELVAFVGGG